MVSFGELLLIALVGLLIIGPRRLPETVRFLALQMGRLRQAMTQTRKMVEDELGMDDIRRQLHNEQIMRNLKATREEIERTGKGLPPSARTSTADGEQDGEPGTTPSASDTPSAPDGSASDGAASESDAIGADDSGASQDDHSQPRDRQNP